MKFKIGDIVRHGKGLCTYEIIGFHKEHRLSDKIVYKVEQISSGNGRHTHTVGNIHYQKEEFLVPVKTVKAYAYEGKDGIQWFSTEKSRKGYKRALDFDFEKEVKNGNN